MLGNKAIGGLCPPSVWVMPSDTVKASQQGGSFSVRLNVSVSFCQSARHLQPTVLPCNYREQAKAMTAASAVSRLGSLPN